MIQTYPRTSYDKSGLFVCFESENGVSLHSPLCCPQPRRITSPILASTKKSEASDDFDETTAEIQRILFSSESLSEDIYETPSRSLGPFSTFHFDHPIDSHREHAPCKIDELFWESSQIEYLLELHPSPTIHCENERFDAFTSITPPLRSDNPIAKNSMFQTSECEREGAELGLLCLSPNPI